MCCEWVYDREEREKKAIYNNLSQVPNHDHTAIQMYDSKPVSVNLQLHLLTNRTDPQINYQVTETAAKQTSN